MYLCLNIVQTLYAQYKAGLLQIPLLLCNRMLKNVNFTKRLEAATKDIDLCKFQFQIAVLHHLA